MSCGERRSRAAEKLKRRVSFRVISSERSCIRNRSSPVEFQPERSELVVNKVILIILQYLYI